MSSKEERIEVFQDTERWIKVERKLLDAVAGSIWDTVFYSADVYPEIRRAKRDDCVVTVTKHRSYEAAMLAHEDDPSAKICVLLMNGRLRRTIWELRICGDPRCGEENTSAEDLGL